MSPHLLLADEHLHLCECGDWHPGSFFREADATYVLVSADMLKRALNAAWIASNDAVGHQLPPDLAPHLFAALKGPAR